MGTICKPRPLPQSHVLLVVPFTFQPVNHLYSLKSLSDQAVHLANFLHNWRMKHKYTLPLWCGMFSTWIKSNPFLTVFSLEIEQHKSKVMKGLLFSAVRLPPVTNEKLNVFFFFSLLWLLFTYKTRIEFSSYGLTASQCKKLVDLTHTQARCSVYMDYWTDLRKRCR